jgi:CHRD domain
VVRESGEIRFTVVILNPERETFVAGHIHEAPFGVNGDVVVPLFSGMNNAFVFVQHGEVFDDDAARVCADPAGFYVNYHTSRFPGGAVRGQLG